MDVCHESENGVSSVPNLSNLTPDSTSCILSPRVLVTISAAGNVLLDATQPTIVRMAMDLGVTSNLTHSLTHSLTLSLGRPEDRIFLSFRLSITRNPLL